MSTFDLQEIYNKHQTSCDCDGDCSCSSNDDCGCCPPGLVSILDCNGNHAGCVTPNDAACHDVNSHIPATGYVKLYHPITNEYLGDVTIAESLTFISTIDPGVNPPVSGTNFNMTTNTSASVGAAPPAGTNSVAIDFKVDRVGCNNEVVVSLDVSTPDGITFLGGATEISIPQTESVLSDGILIDDTIAVGVYNITVLYSSCNLSKVKVITLTVV